jgi:uncharacterized UBP type Zn finger protein
MDFILRLIIRGIYHLDHQQPWRLSEYIPTETLANSLSRKLKIDVSKLQPKMWQINNCSIKFVESADECIIMKLNIRSLLSDMAPSTEDSLPIVESFE